MKTNPFAKAVAVEIVQSVMPRPKRKRTAGQKAATKRNFKLMMKANKKAARDKVKAAKKERQRTATPKVRAPNGKGRKRGERYF